MGLERRGNKLYFYSKSRSFGKVTSAYLGRANDDLVRDYAGMMQLYKGLSFIKRKETLEEKELLKAEKRKVDQKDKQERKHYEQACNAANEAVEAINSLVKAVLLISGFHQHRGQWRKARKAKASIERAENNVINTR